MLWWICCIVSPSIIGMGNTICVYIFSCFFHVDFLVAVIIFVRLLSDFEVFCLKNILPEL